VVAGSSTFTAAGDTEVTITTTTVRAPEPVERAESDRRYPAFDELKAESDERGYGVSRVRSSGGNRRAAASRLPSDEV
jgi:hypothetical protein